MTYKPITQEHGTGCGVACTAFVLGITYQKALQLFRAPKKAWGKGYSCKDIVRALSAGRRAYTYCYLKPSQRGLPKRAGVIVYVQRSKLYLLGHFLARTSDRKWMNPWSNFLASPRLKASFNLDSRGKRFTLYSRWP
jgi:hypothetical protein